MTAPEPLPEIITARELAEVARLDPESISPEGVRVLAGAVLELHEAASAGLMRQRLYEPKRKGTRT